jgi:uncharacterized membrane protein
MDQKTISWVSYLTLIGWIIGLVSYNGSPDKSSLARFHLRQMLGIMILGISISILSTIVTLTMGWSIGNIIRFVNLGTIVLWILGLIAALNGEEKPVPLVGDFFQKTFTFIK